MDPVVYLTPTSDLHVKGRGRTKIEFPNVDSRGITWHQGHAESEKVAYSLISVHCDLAAEPANQPLLFRAISSEYITRIF